MESAATIDLDGYLEIKTRTLYLINSNLNAINVNLKLTNATGYDEAKSRNLAT